MSVLDAFAHGVVGVLASLVRLMLGALEAVEETLRTLMADAGLNSDVQSLALILLAAVFLFGVLKLLHGWLRTIAALTLFLVLAHTLGRLAQGPVG